MKNDMFKPLYGWVEKGLYYVMYGDGESIEVHPDEYKIQMEVIKRDPFEIHMKELLQDLNLRIDDHI